MQLMAGDRHYYANIASYCIAAAFVSSLCTYSLCTYNGDDSVCIAATCGTPDAVVWERAQDMGDMTLRAEILSHSIRVHDNVIAKKNNAQRRIDLKSLSKLLEEYDKRSGK